MKYLSFLFLLGLISIKSFSQDLSKINGWTVLSDDSYFDKTRLRDIGVKDRRMVIKELKQSRIKLFSFDFCNSLLKKHLSEAYKYDIEEKQYLCFRSINFSKKNFLAIYRSELNEKGLLFFREKMNKEYSD
ncbi:MAG: hypothetical protein CME61_05170 [Halobacteriovoraceae bacterium]|nr:hypothetical protein [Halobacteriovoraceae bacterium]